MYESILNLQNNNLMLNTWSNLFFQKTGKEWLHSARDKHSHYDFESRLKVKIHYALTNMDNV